MAEIPPVENCVDNLPDYIESLVQCCHCRGSLRDPVMQQCLHNCCRSCIKSTSTNANFLKPASSEACPACGNVTEHNAVMQNGLLDNYMRLITLSSDVVHCSTCDVQDVAAVYWCADCCRGLCDSCYMWHNRFHQRHRSAELEVARTWTLSQLTPDAQCSTHKRQMEKQCFTCRAPKCLLCYESCRAGKHEVQRLSHDETRRHLSAITDAMRTNRQRLSHAVSSLEQKCQDVGRRLHGDRIKNGARLLVQNRRSLHDATINAFDTSVRSVCVNLQRIWDICTTVIGRRIVFSETVTLASHNIETLSVERLEGLKVLRESSLLKKIFKRCISELRVSLQCRWNYWEENGAFCIDGSLPLTSDIVLRSCLGATNDRRASPRAPLLFGQVSVTFRTPVHCRDLAVTRDGHVLLAAREHGLLVYSDRGQQLSSWRPERQSNGRDDRVMCVAALCDGRAAVGVLHAQLVVLLKLSQTGDTWLQDRRVAVLQSRPCRLAAHGDVLAAAELRRNEQQQTQLRWVAGREVKLLKLSSGQVLYTQSRDYDIYSVALTALCVVTVSLGPVKRSSGATPEVLDAFSHSGEFLWRHETRDEEYMRGLCVSADTWSRLYVTVLRRDRSSSRVMAIGGADGRDSREVLSSRTYGRQLPVELSLARGQQRTVLVVLSWDRTADQYDYGHYRTVSLYEAKIE